jgi:hypothetical protein
MKRLENIQAQPRVKQNRNKWDQIQQNYHHPWEMMNQMLDLSGLTPDQRRGAVDMLCKEADAFVMNDEDVGCIERLQMNIHLTDNQPIQKNYLSMPRPLYPEVKAYIGDLLNRNFIRKSKSSSFSSVVCVRKKDDCV